MSPVGCSFRLFASFASAKKKPFPSGAGRFASTTALGGDDGDTLDTMPVTTFGLAGEELAAPMYVVGLPCLVKVGDDNFAPRLSS